MPVNKNPGSLKTGHGKAAPDENVQRPALTGAGLVGAGPNIGVGSSPAESADSSSGLAGHVLSPKGAHPASAIQHDGYPDVLISTSVEGALDELIGTIMEKPPYVGQWSRSTGFSGIPDWGVLKLADQSLEHFGLLANKPSGTSAGDIFPYYHSAPGPAQDPEFSEPGGDPRTDHLWNDGVVGLAGAGTGQAHNGGFTRDGDSGVAPLELFRVQRLFARPTGVDGETGLPARIAVTISGTVFPADRGVLALLHFPPSNGGDLATEFLAQPLIKDYTALSPSSGRVVAALLLGNGVLGDKCIHKIGDCHEPHVCDGDPGGIFALGVDPGTSNYNPFRFPGRATGQYDLVEIYNGIDNLGGDPLVAPFDDLDGDTVAGAARTPSATVPAPGQVRLGTDPTAGVDPVENGIPVLGANTALYTVAPTTENGSLGLRVHGDAVVEDSNFFRFRLPVLKDYSQSTGLKWTPRGVDATSTKETARYFEVPTDTALTYPDGAAVGASLRSAGFYESSFDEDYWVWQIARYRQTFLLQSHEGDGIREEVGTYWLVHFKTERDFEALVRDGVFPWDVTNGYEVYGASLVDTSALEADGNIANEWAAATAPVAPSGPAPDYGYAADSYHNLRSTIMLDPAGASWMGLATGEWDWLTGSAAGTEAYMTISGVGYYTPLFRANSVQAFTISDIDIVSNAGFWTSYRTDDDDLTGGVAPAVIASMNPMFINNAPFAYDAHTGLGRESSLDLVVNVSPAAGHIPSADYQRKHRFELPFTFLGSNGAGFFTDANGPLDADALAYSATAGGNVDPKGDSDNPSFSQDAVLRAYFRRPLAHTSENTATLPFAAADGHGYKLTAVPGDNLLFHSTRFDKTGKDGQYGNFVVAAFGAAPNTSYAELFTVGKDAQERFLDETHRLRSVPPAGINGTGPYTAATITALQGPGMGGWAGGPVEVPTRAGIATAPWNEYSWLLMEDFLLDLSAVGTENENALQVAGLPDRNPPISAGVEVPFPSAGLVMYPHKNYSVGYHPASASVEHPPTQPDYSGIANAPRVYIRTLDAAFSHHAGGGSTPPVSKAGQTQVTLRLDGITLSDLQYTAPGPGAYNSSALAVLVKVPGLTTWMDIGRADGSGPSKQDPVLDGAGCQVIGPGTYTFTDPETGYKGCYVTVDVGPVASFFANPGNFSGYTTGSPAGESPLMVKVQMGPGATNYALEKVLAGAIFGAVEPGADPRDVRGLFGISVVHPNETLLDAD